jgi:uncharacterized protein (TIGR00288 family)
MANGNNQVDVAVFIDFENVYVSVRDKLDANPNFESIMDRCADLGRVVISKAYADWYRYPRVTSALYANGIEPMYVPTYYYDREQGRTGRAIKNSVDIHICIDAMKTLFTTTNIAKFVLVTGDRDFIPLVNSIRQQGKEVIVIGIGGAASAHLAQSADEFIFYEQLVGQSTTLKELLDDRPKAKMPDKEQQRERTPEPAPPAAAPAPVAAQAAGEPDVFDLLAEAVKLARKRNYVSTLGSLKLLMKELMGGDFRENKYRDANGRSFAKFKDFVLEAERRGKVQVFTSGTVNEVFLPGEDPQTLSQFASVLTEEQPAPVAEAEAEVEEVEAEATPAAASRSRRRRRRGPRDRRDELEAAGMSPEAEEAEGEPAELASEDLVVLSELESVLVEPALPEALEEPLEEVARIIEDEIVEGLVESGIDPEQIGAVVVEVSEGEPTLLVELPEAATEAPVVEDAPAVIEDAPAVAEEAPVVEKPTAVNRRRRAPAKKAAPAPEAEPQQPEAEPQQPEAPSFSDEEWLVFRRMASGFEKAISFSQITTSLRDVRNQKQINRTNADLDAMVKQAINNDMFERSGRGARITYRLRPDLRVEGA